MSEYLTLMSMDENMAGSTGGPLFFPTATSPSEPSAQVDRPGSASAELVPTMSWNPRLGPSAIQLDPLAVQASSEAEIQQQVLEMLACLRRRPLQEVVAGALHTDGTLVIDSMTAVWVISTVGKAFGRRLVRLSTVDRDSLRSVGGVSKLIKQTTSSLSVTGAA